MKGRLKKDVLLRNLIFESIRSLNEWGEDNLAQSATVSSGGGGSVESSSPGDILSTVYKAATTHSCSVKKFPDSIKQKITTIDSQIKSKITQLVANSIDQAMGGAPSPPENLSGMESSNLKNIDDWNWENKDLGSNLLITPEFMGVFNRIIDNFSFSVENIANRREGGGPCNNIIFKMSMTDTFEEDINSIAKKYIENDIMSDVFAASVENINKEIEDSINKRVDTVSSPANIENSVIDQYLYELQGKSTDSSFNSLKGTLDVVTGGITAFPEIIEMANDADLSWFEKISVLGQHSMDSSQILGLVLGVENFASIMKGIAGGTADTLTIFKQSSRASLLNRIKNSRLILKKAKDSIARYIFYYGPAILVFMTLLKSYQINKEDEYYRKAIEVYKKVCKKYFDEMSKNIIANKTKFISGFQDGFLNILDLMDSIGDVSAAFDVLETSLDKTISRPKEEKPDVERSFESYMAQYIKFKMDMGATIINATFGTNFNPPLKEDERERLISDLKKDYPSTNWEEMNNYQLVSAKAGEKMERFFDPDIDAWYRYSTEPVENDIFSPAEAYFLRDVLKVGNNEYIQKIIDIEKTIENNPDIKPSDKEVAKANAKMKEIKNTTYLNKLNSMVLDPGFFKAYMIVSFFDSLLEMYVQASTIPESLKNINLKINEIIENINIGDLSETPFSTVPNVFGFFEYNKKGDSSFERFTGSKIINGNEVKFLGKFNKIDYEDILDGWFYSTEVLQYVANFAFSDKTEDKSSWQQPDYEVNGWPVVIEKIKMEKK